MSSVPTSTSVEDRTRCPELGEASVLPAELSSKPLPFFSCIYICSAGTKKTVETLALGKHQEAAPHSLAGTVFPVAHALAVNTFGSHTKECPS